uniref:Uncharacterized protein n=1 Tax=Corethron hystrix TaxID=216773 RepID=A0A7S1B437_9STRA|mmetsp:Transcript_11426/g.25074  ORF Transcript_11426/g.25074 Transcript_11426/m.25074 type:complete len:260 (+) Transcript_11426:114-893(+)|eukprot:CAMPEP_0113315220 /NCGR_PEP_ID=MMETSP0010_2-20120614/10974_1 /TAXON_ID=216773 ORGANISM="Corethron hystrix, Strain 308" /NCGR_SAMPLE_ID=MMETSP0010_2 /ASSEMBLY_ACC=CAM_ASM_000155 /LENGTH=259 /DNA_ID=CAMNT_0000171675 /DNA_START=12 /DNA_END=791 /DNA_ORIENTATION=- /assembly_acc=CAM_ASM_000155
MSPSPLNFRGDYDGYDTSTTVTEMVDDDSTLPSMKYGNSRQGLPALELITLCLPQCNSLLGNCGVPRHFWERESSESSSSYDLKVGKKNGSLHSQQQQECLQQIATEIVKCSKKAEKLLAPACLPTDHLLLEDSFDHSKIDASDLYSETTSSTVPTVQSKTPIEIPPVLYPKPVRRLRSQEMKNLYQVRPDLDISLNPSLDEEAIDWDEVEEAATGVGLDDDSIEIVTPQELESYIMNDVNDLSPQQKRWRMRPKKFLC